ncbi:MAG: class I adenylate-forming enzyme family protein [Candidatus Dormibacteria bacterium]
MDVRNVMRRAVDAWADREAIIYNEQRLTYAQAWDRGVRMANILKENGVRPGDRVASLEDNTLQAADFYLACTIGNFVRVPLYVRNSLDAHQHMVGHTECVALVTQGTYGDEGQHIADAVPSLKYHLVRDEGYEGMLASASDVDPDPRINPGDNYLIRHTAGTTGRSKGVAFTHHRWLAVARDWLYNWPTINMGDAFLHQSPISHGSGYFFTPAWMNCARNVMMEKLVPADVLAIIEREKITHMLGIPTILSFIVRDPSIKERDLSSVKGIIVSGAPISDATARAAYDVFGDALFMGFGQTEINPVTFMPAGEWFAPDAPPERLRSTGRCQPFGEIAILDTDTHEPLPVGEEGEIAARGDGQMEGFWGEPEATAERIHDGWILTGDVGKVDAQGYLYIMDRAADMIVSGGFNIYPAELENVITSHKSVVEAAVFSVPDEKWGESPAAVVVIRDGEEVTEAEIIALCKDRLGSYKKPKTVVITTDPLPKTIVGKVQKKLLREPFWAGHTRRVAGS